MISPGQIQRALLDAYDTSDPPCSGRNTRDALTGRQTTAVMRLIAGSASPASTDTVYLVACSPTYARGWFAQRGVPLTRRVLIRELRDLDRLRGLERGTVIHVHDCNHVDVVVDHLEGWERFELRKF